MFRSLLPRHAGLAGLLACLAIGLATGDGARAGGPSLGVEAPNAARPVSERIAPDRLSAMPQTEVKAVTPWTEGEVTFGGVAFDAFARSLGIGGGAVILRALNAYEISLDVEQVIADGGVLALRMDGRPIPVRDKGPVWLVFPSVERPDLAASDKTHMWIWQIDEIRFLGE